MLSGFWKVLGATVGTILLFILIFFGGYRSGKKNQYSQNIIEQRELQHKVDSLENLIQKVNLECMTVTLKHDSLLREIKYLDQDVAKIERDYDKKINSVIKYTNPQLEQFFCDRYGTN